MEAEDNKALVRRFISEVFNQGNVDALSSFLAEGFIDHNAPPGLPPGAEGMEQWYSMLLEAFPDFRCEVEDIVAEGDKVVMRSVWRGTHTGRLREVAPTGRFVISQGIDILRIRDGRFVERWGHTDALEMLQRLSAPVAPAPAVPTTPISAN